MEFTGRYVIPVPPEAVWAGLNDSDVLKACIPGCETLTRVDATNFAGAAKLRIGPMSATFRGRITLTELDPPKRCVVKGEGEGGVAGFARGQAEILLAAEENGTMLSYRAGATVGGKLAQIGQRLIDGAARQIADDFFARFTVLAAASETQPAPENPDEAKLEYPTIATRTETARREGLAPEIWVVGLMAVIAVLLVLFGIVLR